MRFSQAVYNRPQQMGGGFNPFMGGGFNPFMGDGFNPFMGGIGNFGTPQLQGPNNMPSQGGPEDPRFFNVPSTGGGAGQPVGELQEIQASNVMQPGGGKTIMGPQQIQGPNAGQPAGLSGVTQPNRGFNPFMGGGFNPFMGGGFNPFMGGGFGGGFSPFGGFGGGIGGFGGMPFDPRMAMNPGSGGTRKIGGSPGSFDPRMAMYAKMSS